MKTRSISLPIVTVFLFMATITLFSSCGKKEEDEKPYIRTKTAETTIEAAGVDWEGWSTTLLTNISISELKVLCSEKWCSAELTESKGNQCMLTVKAEDNSTHKSRKATITVKHIHTIASVDFTLKQESATETPFIKFEAEIPTLSAEAHELEQKFETNVLLYRSKVSSSETWCKATVLLQPYRVKLVIDKNESLDERQAVVTVSSTDGDVSGSLTVRQQAGYPVIRFSSDSEGKNQRISASSTSWSWTLRSNLPYNDLEVKSDGYWCSAELSGSDEAADIKNYTLTVNVEENNDEQQREAVVTISSWSRGISISFKVTQKEKAGPIVLL